MKFCFICLVCVLVFFHPHAHADADTVSEVFATRKQRQLFGDARFEVGYSVGRFIGIKKDYAELDAFFPYSIINDWVSFADIRGYHLNNGRWGASVGVGLRTWGFDKRVWGANIYYDYLEGHFHKGFRRVGIGIEWLGEVFDFRFNGYFPGAVQTNRARKIVFDRCEGSFVATCREKQFATCEGMDAECGMSLWSWQNFHFYGAVGPYYYQHRKVENFFGGQARLEINWKTLLSVQVRTSFDNVNHSQVQARFLLSLPLDVIYNGIFFDFVKNLLTQPVQRTGIIFTSSPCCDYNWNW